MYGEYKVLQFEAGETFMRIMEQHGGMEGWKKRKEQKRNRKIAAQKGKRKREEREGDAQEAEGWEGGGRGQRAEGGVWSL